MTFDQNGQFLFSAAQESLKVCIPFNNVGNFSGSFHDILFEIYDISSGIAICPMFHSLI